MSRSEVNISAGVSVSVESSYSEEYSNPHLNKFVFSYLVEIKNTNPFPVQLLSREWYIFDSFGHVKSVKGEGVIGEQPIILPDETHSYQSGCQLHKDMGFMEGSYLFVRTDTMENLDVKIPRFNLINPCRLN
jgi:ApaG protein